MFQWLFTYASTLIWAVPLIVLCLYLTMIFGARFGLPSLAMVLGLILFTLGRKSASNEIVQRSLETQAKREKAYAEIDRRNTSGIDVADRLRNGRF